jgi:hypothetical protein
LLLSAGKKETTVVTERSGAIHFHLLVVLPFAIREGWLFDIDQGRPT